MGLPETETSLYHKNILSPGQQYTIMPNTMHWFKAGAEEAVVSEFSAGSTDVFTEKRIIRETVHGAYKKKPKPDFVRLREISTAVEMPLVLHGGSGLSDDDFKTAVKNGISKINIFTDLCIAGEKFA